MIRKLWLVIEGILILTLIFLLFYGLLVWSANHGDLETVKGTSIFGIAGILFISPFIDKTINLWGRLKLTKQYSLGVYAVMGYLSQQLGQYQKIVPREYAADIPAEHYVVAWVKKMLHPELTGFQH